MSNKNNKNNASLTEQVLVEQVEPVETIQVEQTQIKNDKQIASQKKTNNKKNNKKQVKEKAPNKLIQKLKGTSSELKKVSWPSFSQVVKKTGVVLTVCLIFAVFLFGIDRLLSWLFSLLIGG